MSRPKIKRQKELIASFFGPVPEGIEVDFLIKTKRHERLVFSDAVTLMGWLDEKEQRYVKEGNNDLVGHCQDLRSDIVGFLMNPMAGCQQPNSLPLIKWENRAGGEPRGGGMPARSSEGDR
ncbi:MAG: hypothetical protein LLG06_02780 [Desulfobacteraceae bacterium]|nr:hypothetical protein [Desulfobacteraceae bacterium]